jgi:hypothetical protein
MQVNIVNLRRELGEGLNRSMAPRLQKRIMREVEVAKNQLIRSFESAPPSVSLETAANMDRAERGDFRDGFVENGNLYAFLGINDDRNPVEEVRGILEQNVKIVSLTQGSVNQKGEYVITGKVQVPQIQEINNVSKLPWGTKRGWIDAVVNGLRGLPNFLIGDFSNKSYSLSGGGIEAKDKTGKLINTGRGEFQPYRGNYLFEFIERFKRKIRGQN